MSAQHTECLFRVLKKQTMIWLKIIRSSSLLFLTVLKYADEGDDDQQVDVLHHCNVHDAEGGGGWGEAERDVSSASLRPGAQHKPDLSLHDFMHTSNPQTCFLASSLCKWCSGLIQRDAKKKACYFLSVCAHTHVRNLHHVTGYLVFISPRSCSRVPLQTVSCKWASDECMGNLYLYDRMCQR